MSEYAATLSILYVTLIYVTLKRNLEARVKSWNWKRGLRTGFADGFASPFVLFLGRRHRYAYRHYDGLAIAWQEVGNDLHAAMTAEGVLVDEANKRQKVRSVTH